MAGAAIYALTFFHGHNGVIPTGEYTNLTVDGVTERIADEPQILTDKEWAVHFITSPLQVAPYVAKTALRFPPGAEGRQRSASHVIESAWFAFDVDHITAEDKAGILSALEGLTYCAFSTHSHGKEAGEVRMRVLLFMDRALEPADWTRAWHVIDCALFDGKADKTTAHMYQCAAVWCAHPERVSQSFRHVGKGELLSADTLVAQAPKPKPRRAPYIPPRSLTPGAQRGRYDEALHWLDAGGYTVWMGVRMSLSAAVVVGEMADAEAAELWLTWSLTAPAARQVQNGDARYSPAVMWERRPTLTTAPGILKGSLLKKAGAAAERCLKLEWPGKLSPRAIEAATYLRRKHWKTLAKLRSAK